MSSEKESISSVSQYSTKQKYIIFYNGASMLLWLSLLIRVLTIITIAGFEHLYPSSGNYVRVVQTLALAEVVHSLVGLVRAPVGTTAMQVASRLLLVWGIVGVFGELLLVGGDVKQKAVWGKGSLVWATELQKAAIEQQAAVGWTQLFYLGMLVAWSVTEIVRYGYFSTFLAGGNKAHSVPGWLTWARYNMFFGLYPLGISCECLLIYKSLALAKPTNTVYYYFLWAVLAIYVPGKSHIPRCG